MNGPAREPLEQRVAAKMDWRMNTGSTLARRQMILDIVAVVREQCAAEIDAERDVLSRGPYPADAQWLRALERAAALIAKGDS